MSLLIKNGTVVNPAKQQHEVADVLVKDGKIAAIGQNLSADGAEVYDATGLIVAPGLIDIHTHLREPGQEAKEDFHSGTQAAAAGGFTRVVTMANTTPVVDNAALVRGLKKQAELTGVVKVEFIGAVSKNLEGKELAELGDMAEAGVVAYSDDGHYVESAAFMRRALEYSSMFNKMVIDHAEDISLTKNGHMHEGFVSYEMGVIGRPAVAEDLAVARDILLAEMTGGHIHIAHVSSKNTVDIVRRAKAKGVNVTCEVTSQHLSFTDEYLREPGQEAKEDFHSGTQAAAAGGFTRVVTMANTTPVVDNAALVRGLKKQAELTGVVKVEFIGAVSKNLEGKELAELGDMAEAGVVAYSDDGHYVESAAFMRRALEYSSMFNKMVIDHAEDISLTKNGHMHEGFVSYEMGVIGRPAVAEDLAVARDILLAEMTGGHIHIAHVSSKNTVDMVRRAKAKGLNVTCEVTSQHLSFTDEYLRDYNPAFKMAPPIRSEDHRQALLEGLKDGTIDAIITDHAPHAFEEKDHEFCCAPNGFSGLETSLAGVITNAYGPDKLSIDQVVYYMSTRPAELMHLDAGVLEVGKPADITVFSTTEQWTVDRNKFYTKGKVSPFDGMTVTGKAKLTVVDGNIVMKEGVVL